MSGATRLGDLQWRLIETINQVLETNEETMEERHRVLRLIRAHLDARIDQTRPRGEPAADQYANPSDGVAGPRT